VSRRGFDLAGSGSGKGRIGTGSGDYFSRRLTEPQTELEAYFPRLNWKHIFQLSDVFVFYNGTGSKLVDLHRTVFEHSDDENAHVCSGGPRFKDCFATGAPDFYLILLAIKRFCSTCIRQ